MKTVVNSTNVSVLNAARAPIKLAQPTIRNRNAMQDSDLSSELTQEFIDKFIYDTLAKTWFGYNEGLWMPLDMHLMHRMLANRLRSILTKGFPHHRLVSVEKFLGVDLALDEWSTQPNLLPLKNGILNTQTLEIQEHSPKNRFTWQLPYCYDESATMPITAGWLSKSTSGDADAINIIRAFFRSALLSEGVQKFLELIGPGGTGKSTMIRLLTMMIGDNNCASTDLYNLETIRFETAKFYQKKLVIISDSMSYGGSVAVLKAMTGGDPLRLERKNQQQIATFMYQGATVIAANEAIQSTDYTSGLSRRRLPIIFKNKITDADQEKWSSEGGLETAMQLELPGLLNWILLMSEKEMQNAIGRINSGLSATGREHLCETNRIAQWIEDNLVTISGYITYVGNAKDFPEQKLYPNYKEWCAENGNLPISMSRFSKTLIDVAEQLKLDVKLLNRDSAGKRICGLKIRELSDISLPTPVKQQWLDGRADLEESLLLQSPNKILVPKKGE
ncbi:MAG: phage/plasmid primase, P4 family [Methylobacter sp.]|jgi:putative DNA primase/helicase|nr:phage/plasmid primase, P4 family [Methylobacter sp.]